MNSATRVLLGMMLAVATPASAADEGTTWVDRMTFKGDLRLRFESIDEDDGSPNRNRERVRARISMMTQASDTINIVIGLATGGDNPVSRNVSFDGGFSTKDIGFELIYVDWEAAEGTNIYAGKMKNPLFRAGDAPLIWDGDLNPEGFALKYTNDQLFANVAAFGVEERSSGDDTTFYAAQVGGKFDLGGGSKLTAGVGYFAYSETIGFSPFHDGRARGNTVDASGNYLFEYRNTEAFAEFDTKVNDWPLKVFAQYTVNNEVDREDTAFAFGAKIGSAKKKGATQFGWTYLDIEADAVIGTFSDSDFSGGGTDASGHILKAKYMIADSVSLSGTVFVSEVDRFQGVEHDYNRLQIDLEFKFK